MKLGLSIGYWGAHVEVPVALVQCAEELGYDSSWSAEAYGSAISPLAFLAGVPMAGRTSPRRSGVPRRRGLR
jgi:alkanesulfonate monooxygenase SsuD/methylene tetrahydromethanopterin reductase-like flavin-dependent oxidoreductase (luciferase family)